MEDRVAEEFSTAQSYDIGELVLYGGVLYRFVSSHITGAWNAAQVNAVDEHRQQDVTRIVGGTQVAREAVAYAEHYPIVFEPGQEFNSRYKYTLTSAEG